MKSFKTIIILILPLALFASNIFNAQVKEKVDKFPAPLGGIESIAKKITYPAEAKKAGIQGMVLVKAVIDENGNVTFAEVEKGVDPELDKAALKAVKETKFTPGEIKNKKVKTEISVPVKFKLNKDCDKKET